MKDDSAISNFIAENGFALIVSTHLEATHLPLIYQAEEGNHGVLYGHFARSNEHWKKIEHERVLVVFNGPHSYVSPTWYNTQPAVPTWNYVSVHCYGHLTLLNDAETRISMNALVSKYEPSLLTQPELMPEEYTQRLRHAVVGFKIVVDEIQAKEKLGQHRRVEDQQGVYFALKTSHDSNAQALSLYMEKRKVGTGQ